MAIATYELEFFDSGYTPSGKTRIWLIRNGYNKCTLGTIKWYAAWRRYAFYPDADTVFDEGCMRTILEFLALKNKEHHSG